MSEPLQKINIGGHQYEFSRDTGDNSFDYTFLVENKRFRFKRWAWGEKNRITNECVAFNPATNGFEVDTIAFNERMLANTIVEVDEAGKETKPTLDIVRGFKAALGDQLLMIAQWMNSIENGVEKKTCEISEVPGDDGLYELHINDDVFKLGMWTWGEKNKVTDQSVKFDPADQQLKMDLRIFNESLLLATIKDACINAEPVELSIDFLRNLDAGTGDILLQYAQEINNIAEKEKKNSKMP